MRLFPGFLLFFKDGCQRRSCRISHQSPPPMSPPPALCLIFLLLYFCKYNETVRAHWVHGVCFSCFRWRNIANVWNKTYSCIFQSSLPRGWRAIRVHTHGKHFLPSELSLLAVIPNYPVSLLSRALHSGIWLMPSQSLVWSTLPSGMWVRLSEMFPELARSWFPPGWLTDTACSAIQMINLLSFMLICGLSLDLLLLHTDVEAERGTRAADSARTVQEKQNAWHLLVAPHHYHKQLRAVVQSAWLCCSGVQQSLLFLLVISI